MKKRKGFTLIELIAAMAILVVLLTTFAVILSGSSAMIKEDKEKVRIVSFTQYFIQTAKADGKSYFSGAGITPTQSCGGYLYFNDKDDLSAILESTSFKNDLIYIISGSGTSSGKVFKGTYSQLFANPIRKSYKFAAYFEISSGTDMGKDNDKSLSASFMSSGDLVLSSGLEATRAYVKVVDIGNAEKYNSESSIYIGR